MLEHIGAYAFLMVILGDDFNVSFLSLFIGGDRGEGSGGLRAAGAALQRRLPLRRRLRAGLPPPRRLRPGLLTRLRSSASAAQKLRYDFKLLGSSSRIEASNAHLSLIHI